jgi:poly(3-hydroxyalkanoate) synthetase
VYLVLGNSFVKYLIAEGYDVYLLAGGIPGLEDKNLSFENYILDYLPKAVECVLKSSSAEEYTLFGHCMGGTISAMYASLFPEKLKNLVLLATPAALIHPKCLGGVFWEVRWARVRLLASRDALPKRGGYAALVV